MLMHKSFVTNFTFKVVIDNIENLELRVKYKYGGKSVGRINIFASILLFESYMANLTIGIVHDYF